MSTFLSLPVELRLDIYTLYLEELQSVSRNQQPTNAHYALLHTCRLISYEAGQLAKFRSYVSLIHEDQMRAFVANITDDAASMITRADVANDTRMVDASNHSFHSTQLSPASSLYLAVTKCPIRHLRVFESSRSRPMNDFVDGAVFSFHFEKAMFPYGGAPRLDSYELYLKPFKGPTRIFQVLSPECVRGLRLSGDLTLPTGTSLPSLTNLAINGVTGNYLDQHLEEHFGQSRLRVLKYKPGDRLGFELKDQHLRSLTFGSASGLHTLVLLGCSRLSSSALTNCLGNLKQLRYLALSIVSVRQLASDFVLVLSRSLMVLKLSVIYARYMIPNQLNEFKLCETIEEAVIMRQPALNSIHLHFREEIMTAFQRAAKWTSVASERNFRLRFGPWDENF